MIIGQPRTLIPDLELTFDDPAPRYDTSRSVITFSGDSNGHIVSCAISRDALDDHFGTANLDQKGCLDAFRRNRPIIQAMARLKYLQWPVERPESILIKTTDLPELLTQATKQTGPQRTSS